MSIAILLFSLLLLGKRYFSKGKAILNFKTRFMQDRIMEVLFIQILLVLVVIDYFAHRNYKWSIIILVIYITIIILEYMSTKVGLYENGVVFKSQIYRWDNIYTFRSYTMSNGDIKFVFYIHQLLQKNQLNKWAVTVAPDIGIKMEKILDQKLDRRKN